MIDAFAAAWLLVMVVCPIDDGCRMNETRFRAATAAELAALARLDPGARPPTPEQACHAAKRLLAQMLEPDGSKSIRLMVCAREQAL